MRALLIALVFALSVAVVLAAHPTAQNIVSVGGDLNSGLPTVFNATQFPTTATGEYNITIVANTSVLICLQSLFAPPASSAQWASLCTFPYTFTASGDGWQTFNKIVNLSPGSYAVGISPSAGGVANSSFSLEIDALICDDGSFGSDCSLTATTLTKSLSGQKVASQATQLYVFNLTNTANSFVSSVAVVVTPTKGDPATELLVYTRYAALPSADNTVSAADLTITNTSVTVNISLPAATGSFLWYVAVFGNFSGSSSIDYNVTLRVDYCNSTIYTFPCGTPLPTISTTAGQVSKVTVPTGSFAYASLTLTSGSVTISATAADGSGAANLALYVRRGALPTLTEYDLSGCGREDCTQTAFLSITAAGDNTDGTWYIGIFGGTGTKTPAVRGLFDLVRATTSTDAFVWTNEPCPGSCNEANNRGKCDTTTGKCTCVKDYTSQADCSTKSSTHKSSDNSSSGLAVKYIILIVVLCGAVAGVLVGLLVWFVYKKRKQASYTQM